MGLQRTWSLRPSHFYPSPPYIFISKVPCCFIVHVICCRKWLKSMSCHQDRLPAQCSSFHRHGYKPRAGPSKLEVISKSVTWLIPTVFSSIGMHTDSHLFCSWLHEHLLFRAFCSSSLLILSDELHTCNERYPTRLLTSMTHGTGSRVSTLKKGGTVALLYRNEDIPCLSLSVFLAT